MLITRPAWWMELFLFYHVAFGDTDMKPLLVVAIHLMKPQALERPRDNESRLLPTVPDAGEGAHP